MSRFMNRYEIDDRARQYADHPVLGPATQTMVNLRDAADANSDGWCYWPKPSRAAAKLMDLIERDGTARYRFDDERLDATWEEYVAALRPIKAFRTRSGLRFNCELPPGPAKPYIVPTKPAKPRRPAMPKSANPTVLMDSYPVTLPGVSYPLSGERHAAARVAAVVEAYPRPDDIAERLAASIDYSEAAKVTLVLVGENMVGALGIQAMECTLRNNGTAYLPKGNRTRGYRLDPTKVLDMIPGYNTAEAARRLAEVANRFPQTVALTQERLDALPERSDTVVLGVFGRWALPDEANLDAVYLVTGYDNAPDENGDRNDIIDGVLLWRSGYSESGTCYGRDLLTMGGEIVDLPPITVAEAIAMIAWDHDDRLAFVRGDGPPASSGPAPIVPVVPDEPLEAAGGTRNQEAADELDDALDDIDSAIRTLEDEDDHCPVCCEPRNDEGACENDECPLPEGACPECWPHDATDCTCKACNRTGLLVAD